MFTIAGSVIVYGISNGVFTILFIGYIPSSDSKSGGINRRFAFWGYFFQVAQQATHLCHSLPIFLSLRNTNIYIGHIPVSQEESALAVV